MWMTLRQIPLWRSYVWLPWYVGCGRMLSDDLDQCTNGVRNHHPAWWWDIPCRFKSASASAPHVRVSIQWWFTSAADCAEHDLTDASTATADTSKVNITKEFFFDTAVVCRPKTQWSLFVIFGHFRVSLCPVSVEQRSLILIVNSYQGGRFTSMYSRPFEARGDHDVDSQLGRS